MSQVISLTITVQIDWAGPEDPNPTGSPGPFLNESPFMQELHDRLLGTTIETMGDFAAQGLSKGTVTVSAPGMLTGTGA